MSITAEIIEYGGWAHNLRLANAHIELVITLEVGPRILRLAALGEGTPKNLFCEFAEHGGGRDEALWRSRGGHRLWLAPENETGHPYTYHPDNAPVEHHELSPGRWLLRPPAEPGGVQKEIEVALHATQPHCAVSHRVSNCGNATLAPLAPWALSVMAPGGVAIVPWPPLGQHPRDLLPNRSLILWPYTDLSDERLYTGRDYLTLSQLAGSGAFKLGIGPAPDWVGYYNDGTLFVKRWAHEAAGEYPDRGSSCELFTSGDMLEVETLAPLATLAPGQSVVHDEEWWVLQGVPPFDARSDAALRAALAAVPGRLANTA